MKPRAPGCPDPPRRGHLAASEGPSRDLACHTPPNRAAASRCLALPQAQRAAGPEARQSPLPACLPASPPSSISRSTAPSPEASCDLRLNPSEAALSGPAPTAGPLPDAAERDAPNRPRARHCRAPVHRLERGSAEAEGVSAGGADGAAPLCEASGMGSEPFPRRSCQEHGGALSPKTGPATSSTHPVR